MEITIPGVRLLKVDLLEQNPWNPNEMTAAELDWLVEEIQENGFLDPINVVPMVDGAFRILGGEHRWRAAKLIGMQEVPCVVLSDERWQDEDLQMFQTVRLNQLHGRQNLQKMAKIYKKFEEQYGPENLRRMFGYTSTDAWQGLVKQAKKVLASTGVPDVVKQKFDAAASKATDASDLGQILNKLMNDYGDTLSYSFMVFSYGGKEHLYIATSKKTRQAMDAVLEHCASWGKDINEVIGEVTAAWVVAAEAAEQAELSADAG